MKIKGLYPIVHRGRGPQSLKKIPEQEAMTLKLKNRVSGKYDFNDDQECSKEILALLNCIENNMDRTSNCSNYIQNLRLCYSNYHKTKKEKKKARLEGVLVPDEKHLTQEQVKNLFLKYRV